jgi:chromosome segregation ATPase
LESLRKKKQERDREKEELKRQLSIGTQHLQLVEEELHEEERNLVEVGKMDKKATGLERIVQKMDQKCKDLDRKKVELERRKIYTGKQLPFGHVIKHVQKEQDRVERKVGNLKRKRDEVAERQSKLKQEVEVGREMCQRAREAVKERVNTLRRQLAEASARIEQLEVEDDIVEVASLRGLLK